jgi:hypothetical protein
MIDPLARMGRASSQTGPTVKTLSQPILRVVDSEGKPTTGRTEERSHRSDLVVGFGGVAYVRTVKTASGARAVRIVHGFRRGARKIEHLGSAHDEKALEALKATARQRLANLIRVGSGLQAE